MKMKQKIAWGFCGIEKYESSCGAIKATVVFFVLDLIVGFILKLNLDAEFEEAEQQTKLSELIRKFRSAFSRSSDEFRKR